MNYKKMVKDILSELRTNEKLYNVLVSNSELDICRNLIDNFNEIRIIDMTEEEINLVRLLVKTLYELDACEFYRDVLISIFYYIYGCAYPGEKIYDDIMEEIEAAF